MIPLTALKNVCRPHIHLAAENTKNVLWRGRRVKCDWVQERRSSSTRSDLKEKAMCAWAGLAVSATTAGGMVGAAQGFHEGMTDETVNFFPHRIAYASFNALICGAIGAASGCLIALTAPVSVPILTHYYNKGTKQKIEKGTS